MACRYWNTPLGAPASRKARSISSAHRGVWSECFRMTVLPAIKAGTMLFTAVSKG
ncbi:hypothetical protein D3C87_2035140 [compost metagenome]